MLPAVTKVLLRAALIISVPLTAFAQLPDYYVKMLSEQQGLNAADFISIAKDKQQYLWLVTQNAVHRFDGKQVWQFPADEIAEEIVVDDQNRKWLLTRSGVHLFVNDFKGFQKIKHTTVQQMSPVCLFNAWNGLYLLLPDGLHVFHEKQQQFVKANEPVLNKKGNIIMASAIHAYYLFFATTDSVYSLDYSTKKLVSFPCKRTSALIPLSENNILVSAMGVQTFYFNFQTKFSREIKAQEVDETGKNKFIFLYNGIAIHRDKFLLSSNQGLLGFDYCSGTFSRPVFYHKGDVLNNTLSVRRLFRDEQGVVYMTHADGVAYCNPQKQSIHFLRYYSNRGVSLPDIDIRSFAEDKNGTIWIGTLNGIANLNLQTGAVKSFFAGNDANSINYPSVRHLLYYKDLLWAGTGGKGVWLLNTSTHQFKRPLFTDDSIGKNTAASFAGEFIWKIEKLQNGDVFIAGGSNCYFVSGKTFITTRLSKNTFSGISRSAVQDSAGRIWHGTASGLNCTNDQYELLFRMKDSFPDKRIAALCEWKKNHMLIGTKGLYEVVSEGNHIKAFRQIKEIPSGRFIYCMEKDGRGNIWLGTDEGLYSYNPVTGKTEYYDAADNVQPQSFNTNGLYMGQNKLMFAGGKSGMNYFDPLRLYKKQTLLQPVVASFSISDDDSSFYRQQQPYQVPYSKKNISINISAPDYEKPFRLMYRYKLKDGNEDWIMNGNSRFVRLNNLSAGNYSFIPSVSYDGKNWFDGKEPVVFTVLQPWWRRWWFVMICLAAAAASLWLLYAYRKKRKQQKEYQRTIDYFAHSGYEHSTVEDILWDIARNCISRLGFEECVIYLVDDKRNMLVQKAAYGAKSPRSFEIVNPIEIPVGKGITGTVAAAGVAEIVNDTSKDKRYIIDDEARFSEITVPIIHNEKVIGVIDSEAAQKNFFTNAHLETLQTIASICSAKISRGMAVAEMKKAETQLAELNTKMLETKFMNLRLQMNPHFLFNSLSSIQHLIVSQQTNEAYKYLSIFSNFLRSVLQYADKTVIKLDEELKMLEMYIKLELLGSDKTFEYSIEVDEQLETEDILIPPLIIQPVVENAIWHGLMNKEGVRKLSISFNESNNEHLVCVIDDNGIGRTAASSITKANLNNFAYQSKSTQLIKERLRLLKEKTGKPASMEVEDKFNNGLPAGTCVKVMIPFYNNDEL